ncbi:hypothetical protein INT45_007913 [Circinella minor]|uniref:Uncharacterized protein n=1 Tax=Circinella minor TaxID=1195481 RepID=A0A8H7SAW2_9FUNG|nr:hypothetical protein INT45_007913 [Circinella minor]
MDSEQFSCNGDIDILCQHFEDLVITSWVVNGLYMRKKWHITYKRTFCQAVARDNSTTILKRYGIVLTYVALVNYHFT